MEMTTRVRGFIGALMFGMAEWANFHYNLKYPNEGMGFMLTFFAFILAMCFLGCLIEFLIGESCQGK
jgi:hypothetical protein